MRELFELYDVPIGDWVSNIVNWLVVNAGPLFDAIRWPIEQVLDNFEAFLLWLPWYVVLLAVAAIAWFKTGWKIALISAGGLLLVGFMGYWDVTMTTLSMILTALVFCVVVGIPLGILMAKNEWVENVTRPVLDAMQTIHPFVYLVPIVMLFGIGKVPGTLATIIFALPPIARLTNLGIRHVPGGVVEAGESFGTSDLQLLFEIQLPLALPSIMAGLNQTLMLALSMVVIVALIAGGGLGGEIYASVSSMQIGRAVESGLAVLILAIVLDRISQTGKRATAS
jgi:glycine betaine/proline transport system permease protein